MPDTDQVAEKLAEPFDPFDIEWRIQKAGKQGDKAWAMVLAYVTNRAIMERLDAVFTIGGWQNEYIPLQDGGFICGIKAKVGNEWITKYDGANATDVEATKGGLSNAMKRAGVQWGIGRYLYSLETTFVTLQPGRGGDDQITTYVKELTKGLKDGGNFHFDRPNLPSWAIPKL